MRIVGSGSRSLWLVQRGKFEKRLQEVTGIDSLINFEYMGSTEFEQGTLFHALKRFLGHYTEIVAKELDIKTVDGNTLTMFCVQGLETDAEATIKMCAKEEYPDLKEHCALYEYVTGGNKLRALYDTNFWWAIDDAWENADTFWMLCPTYEAPRLAQALQKSYMKKIPIEVPLIPTPTTKGLPVVVVDEDYKRQGTYTIKDSAGIQHIIDVRHITSIEKHKDGVLVSTSAAPAPQEHVIVCADTRAAWLQEKMNEEAEWYKKVQRKLKKGV